MISVYTLTDPRDNSVMFIGMAVNMKAKMNDILSPTSRTWRLISPISEIKELGRQPEFDVVATAESREKATEIRNSWIDRLQPKYNTGRHRCKPVMKSRDYPDYNDVLPGNVIQIALTPDLAYHPEYINLMHRISPTIYVLGLISEDLRKRVENRARIKREAEEAAKKDAGEDDWANS